MDKPQFPSQRTINRIKALPTFTADISTFANISSMEIAKWANGQENQVTLNISNATADERSKFDLANQLLSATGHPEMTLFDETARVAEITRDISAEVISKARDSFRKFILRVLQETPKEYVTEHDTFTAPRGAKWQELHYWNNVGLENPEDPVRREALAFFTEIMGSKTDQKLVCNVFEEKVLPLLQENPALATKPEKIVALLLAMFSNMVRGVFYAQSNPKKVYGMRKKAVEVLGENFEVTPA